MTASHKLSLCCIFTCDTSTFLIYLTFRRQDGGIAAQLSLACTNPSKTALSLENRHRPSPLTNPPKPALSLKKHCILASLVKGRWIDGKPQTVALLHFYLRYIHLFDLSNFSPSRRRDCRTTITRLHQPFQNRTIPRKSPPPLAPHQPSQNRTIPRLAPHSWLTCQRELDCDKAISYYRLQHSAISSTLIFAQPYLSQD